MKVWLETAKWFILILEEHAEKEPRMDCESDGGEDGERVRLLPRPRTPSHAKLERHVVSHMLFRDWCRHCVAGRGLECRRQKR